LETPEVAMSYVVVALWRTRQGEAKTVASLLRELAATVRTEPGNLHFAVHQSSADPNDFLLYEIYESEEAFRQHQETGHFKVLVLERAVPLLAARDRRFYNLIDE
jgi:quinol monooxygenase YgiN